MEQGLGQPERTEEEKEFLRATGMNPVWFDMTRLSGQVANLTKQDIQSATEKLMLREVPHAPTMQAVDALARALAERCGVLPQFEAELKRAAFL